MLLVDADMIGQLVRPVYVVLVAKELLLDVFHCLIDHFSRDWMRDNFSFFLL